MPPTARSTSISSSPAPAISSNPARGRRSPASPTRSCRGGIAMRRRRTNRMSTSAVIRIRGRRTNTWRECPAKRRICATSTFTIRPVSSASGCPSAICRACGGTSRWWRRGSAGICFWPISIATSSGSPGRSLRISRTRFMRRRFGGRLPENGIEIVRRGSGRQEETKAREAIPGLCFFRASCGQRRRRRSTPAAFPVTSLR